MGSTPSQPPVTVAVNAPDLLRRGVEALLATHADEVRIVGSLPRPEGAPRPDVLLLDVDDSYLGPDVGPHVEAILARSLAGAVMVLASRVDAVGVVDAVAHGASGGLSKDSTAADLLAGIVAAHRRRQEDLSRHDEAPG